MFIDLIGLLLTVLIVSPQYWYIVIILSFLELVLSIFFSMVSDVSVIEVIAGGIFNTILQVPEKQLLLFSGPIFFLILGFCLQDFRKFHWSDMINPLVNYKQPWPTLMIKMSLFRIAVFVGKKL